MKSIVVKALSFVLLGFFVMVPAFSTPVTTGFGTITQIRAMQGGSVYVTHSLTACSTNIFSIDVTTDQGKAVYAAVMAAFTLQKKISIEVDNTSCAWGMPIRSVYVNA